MCGRRASELSLANVQHLVLVSALTSRINLEAFCWFTDVSAEMIPQFLSVLSSLRNQLCERPIPSYLPKKKRKIRLAQQVEGACC